MTGPNFYTIDFAREVVLQGKSTTFITIGRNDDALGSLDDLYVIVMPNTRTFNSYLRGVAFTRSHPMSTEVFISLI